GYAAYFVLVRSFYARQNTKTPALLNVGLLAVYVVLAYALAATPLGLAGVALAFSCAYAVLAAALLLAMRRELKRLDGRRMASSLARILVAGAVMYLIATLGVAFVGAGGELLERLLIVVGLGGVSLGAYLAVAHLLGTEELRSATSLLKRRATPGG
ncbi:MAG: lipid II flippase MurJ, partial [Actinomycetota bacterium]